MLQPRLFRSLITLRPTIFTNANPPTPLIFTRHASHASEGRANGTKDSAGRRLGAKHTDSAFVVPGNIIFRQRGTHWYPGENCDMGRDHTIFATAKGYVRYYKDPERHKTRKYIGVVFEQGMRLPRGKGGARWRRLGMDVVERKEVEEAIEDAVEVRVAIGGEGVEDINEMPVGGRQVTGGIVKPELAVGKGYMYRESNWSIGRAAERAGVKIREYNSKDRFLAWRKANARKASNAEKKGLRRKG